MSISDRWGFYASWNRVFIIKHLIGEGVTHLIGWVQI